MRAHPGSGRAVALALVALAASADVAGAVPVLRWKDLLVGDPPLERAASVTLDPRTGELCVTDEAARALDVFDPQGYHRFRTDPTSGVRDPLDASLDAEGGFVFTDVTGPGPRTVRRLNFLGEPVEFTAEPPWPGWSPHALRLARNGDILTVDDTGVLARHDGTTGALRWTVALAAPGFERADQVGRPGEAADGTILVPDAGVGMIHVVSADGEDRGTFGTPGAKDGELAFPVGVALGPGGMVLVLDRMRHRVLLYDEEHRFVAEFGRVGFRPGQLFHPLAIEAAHDGRVWVGQGYQGRIMEFRLFDTADAAPDDWTAEAISGS